ncbi:UNVERIFIED_CONTAM: hypothetical protein GTU68_049494 [Idotea baltica]|nr:hypothetical protein [Idotea baltica]
MPHHSSEELNLSVGIRASFTQRLFQSFWHHTQVIKKLGWFEKYFVTPSHHRVHHGVNPQYIDKNYSEFLIIWDKIFGTFEEEHEEVCYGITHPPRTWDPIYINFQYWKQLWDDAVAAPYLWDKIRIWVMPLHWRPRGLPQYDPNEIIGYNKEAQTKFTSQYFAGLKTYLITHVIIAMPFMFLTVNMGFPLETWHRILLTVGIIFMIVSWGGLLNARKWSVILEYFRLIFMGIAAVYVVHITGMVHWNSWITILCSVIAGISIMYAAYFFRENQLEGTPMPDNALKNSFAS